MTSFISIDTIQCIAPLGIASEYLVATQTVGTYSVFIFIVRKTESERSTSDDNDDNFFLLLFYYCTIIYFFLSSTKTNKEGNLYLLARIGIILFYYLFACPLVDRY